MNKNGQNLRRRHGHNATNMVDGLRRKTITGVPYLLS